MGFWIQITEGPYQLPLKSDRYFYYYIFIIINTAVFAVVTFVVV